MEFLLRTFLWLWALAMLLSGVVTLFSAQVQEETGTSRPLVKSSISFILGTALIYCALPQGLQLASFSHGWLFWWSPVVLASVAFGNSMTVIGAGIWKIADGSIVVVESEVEDEAFSGAVIQAEPDDINLGRFSGESKVMAYIMLGLIGLQVLLLLSLASLFTIAQVGLGTSLGIAIGLVRFLKSYDAIDDSDDDDTVFIWTADESEPEVDEPDITSSDEDTASD